MVWPLVRASLALLFVAGASAPGVCQETAPPGWKSETILDGKKFGHCQLVSPQKPPGSPIALLANTPFDWELRFAPVYSSPPPDLEIVRLGLVNDERAQKDDWTSDHGYLMGVHTRAPSPDGRTITVESLRISSKDEILSHLGSARFLRIYYTSKNSLLPPYFQYFTLELPRASTSANAQQGTGANETATAYAALMKCVHSQQWLKVEVPTLGLLPDKFITPAVEAELQAKSDFGLALNVFLVEARQNPDTASSLRQLLFDAGVFYCAAKKFIDYDKIEGENYMMKVASAIQVADIKLNGLSFWPPERSADQVLETDIVMGFADKHLCPGWPNHPRTPS